MVSLIDHRDDNGLALQKVKQRLCQAARHGGTLWDSMTSWARNNGYTIPYWLPGSLDLPGYHPNTGPRSPETGRVCLLGGRKMPMISGPTGEQPSFDAVARILFKASILASKKAV